MKLWIAALLGAGLIAAQNPEDGARYFGQSWVGLLVSASCHAPPKHNRATEEADRTVTDRITTPAVDSSGTRGSSEPGKIAPAGPRDIPQTGDVGMRNNGKIKDPGWKQARHQASSLGSACRVNSDTRQFALLLPDGALLLFDDLANTKIAEQLQSGVMSGVGKILRVQVIGKLQSGAVALDQLQM